MIERFFLTFPGLLVALFLVNAPIIAVMVWVNCA